MKSYCPARSDRKFPQYCPRSRRAEWAARSRCGCSLCAQFRSRRRRVPGIPASGRRPETNLVRSRCLVWPRSCFAAAGGAVLVPPAAPGTASPSRATRSAAGKRRAANSFADTLPSQTRAVPWTDILSFARRSGLTLWNQNNSIGAVRPDTEARRASRVSNRAPRFSARAT